MIFQIIVGISISYILLFLLSIFLKDNSIADIFWGIGFLQVAIHSLYLSGNYGTSKLIFNVIITLWALRIFGYILSKKISKKGEDPRYVKWRNEWKFFYLRSFFQVYILQGFLLLIISIPIILINSSNISEIRIQTIIGLLIALFGLTYETIGDLQLKKFVKTKKPEEIMTKGLWKYSRHPNYFGESVFWLGITIVALQISFITIISWILITLLLRFVSGVPLAEERYKNNKQFQTYKNKTPPMLPNLFIK
jgi:steroid 5-alpha reductase family enzyme